MALPQKTFNQFLSDLITAWSANVRLAPALQPGDALYALFQAVDGQLVFLQALAQLLNEVARAQTSTGADLDSFYAQFNFYRLGATYNTGGVTFGKLSTSPNAILILAGTPAAPGTIVQTAGGAAQYTVVADSSQPTWNASLNAYVMAPGQTSLAATVQALVPGTGPNVMANALSQIATPIPGIDTVTNAAAINNGVNAESDDAFRARFVLFINALSKATEAAIRSAIANTQQGLTYNLLENTQPNGSTRYGEFTAVIDDGSGDPPDSVINAVFNSVDAVRGFTILPEVVRPTLVSPTVALNIRVASGYNSTTVKAAVQAAVAAAVDGIEVGEYSAIFISFVNEAALSVAGVVAVQSGATTINSVAADYTLTEFQRPLISLSAVSVGTY